MAQSDLYMLYHGLYLAKFGYTTESLKYFESFQVQDDDTFIITYPKSGTTWMQEILSLILSEGDLTPVLTLQSFERIPWLEAKENDQLVAKLSSPRAFISHMPYQLMPSTFFSSKAKVIYLARNPKDVVVSMFCFHQTVSFLPDPGTFEEFTDGFLEGNVMFGKWTDHMKSWRNADLGDRILYITYEEMLQDLRGVIKRMLCFLNRNLSEEALKQVIEQSQFKAMKQNKMSNSSPLSQKIMDNMRPPFLRKGTAGDWKNHFSPESETKFNGVISEELNGTNILFPWDEEQK
ncbi:sulfotransferase 2B1-like isoform 2-T2 [Clarias gariepinus]|uniref:sulfotransferase 2B1-like n=1 Tax=Clarias gariepinus TaxID=13013 RepID=UPI00234D82BF|nr:sulfotransferase 2B1-like [Clarias gariepinus]